MPAIKVEHDVKISDKYDVESQKILFRNSSDIIYNSILCM